MSEPAIPSDPSVDPLAPKLLGAVARTSAGSAASEPNDTVHASPPADLSKRAGFVLPGWLGLVAVVIALASLIGVAFSWQSLSRQQSLEQELVRRQEASQALAAEARASARQAEELTRDMAAKVTLLDARLAEVALQRGQLEELMQSMSRSRDENVIGDIEAAIRVAMQQTQITGSVEPLVATLRQAEERLMRYKQPRMEGVRRAVLRDLDRVRAVSVVDIATLTIKLDEVVRLLDELPLISVPERRATDAGRSDDKADRPRADQPRPARGEATGVAQTDGWWATTRQGAHELWRMVWGEARGLLRVTRVDQPEAALLSPDQSYFLRENLKLRLLNARLALLSRQFDTTQADLRDTQTLLARYFDTRSRTVTAAIDVLRQVAGQARQVSVPRPDDTLAALNAAAAGR